MKKIININLSGRVLPIEEPAYELLQSYIASLRRQFANEESRDEIINDIEGRIAEILYEKIQRGVAFIGDLQVEEVIALMGKPEEIAGEEIGIEEESKKSTGDTSSQYAYVRPETRKFYRDENHRIIAGVASGIANYTSIDPAIIRVIFILLSLSSLGFALVAYVLLWIIFPSKNMEGFQGKRFYRNPEERVFGGVASGLAAYFNKSTRTIRLIFLSPLLLQLLFSVFHIFENSWKAQILFNISLGSLTGFSIVLYIVLWIILPKATTPYQKMEMRGEKVDVERIRRHVNEGTEILKEKVKDFEKDVEQTAQRLSQKAEELVKNTHKPGNIFIRAFTALLKGVGLIFKIVFATVFGGVAFVLLITFIVILFVGIVSWPMQNYIWSSSWQQWLAWLTFALFFIVPIVGFIVWLIRRLIGVKSRHSYLGWTFGALWTLGWVSLMLFASSVGKDFQYQQKVVTDLPMADPTTQGVYLTVTQPALEYSNTISWINGDGQGWDLTPDTLKLSTVTIKVEPSQDSLFHLQMVRAAQGETKKMAEERANAIVYSVNSLGRAIGNTVVRTSPQGDTLTVDRKNFELQIVDLASGYAIPASSRYRVQQVEVLVKVPVGKTIVFDKSIEEKLAQQEIRVRQNRKGRMNGISFESQEFRYESDVEYFMSPNGELKRVDGKEMEPTEDSSLPEPPTAPLRPEPALPAKSAYKRTIIPSPFNTILWG
jgi:phage shock protein PspC (stress-responsive transcriptional regulator)